MIDKILSFVEQMGKMALENQHKIVFEKSVFQNEGVDGNITEVDITISNAFQAFVTQNFGNLDYAIIDEESNDQNTIEKLGTKKYVFIIDPIDGTMTYANKYPFWAISIGVFKNGKPFVGAAYAPGLDLLVWADETKAYFRENGKVSEITKLSDASPIVLEYHDSKKLLIRDNFNDKIQGLRLSSQVVSAMYVAIGRAYGYYYKSAIWDIAGIMPVLDKVGVKIQGYDDGVEIDLRTAFGQNVRAEKFYIVSIQKYFDYLKSVTDIPTSYT